MEHSIVNDIPSDQLVCIVNICENLKINPFVFIRQIRMGQDKTTTSQVALIDYLDILDAKLLGCKENNHERKSLLTLMKIISETLASCK